MVRASALKVDITPQRLDHIYVAGFSHNKPATGVHKEIYARILVLQDSDGPLAMVAVDLVGLPAADIDRIRALCTEIPPDRIFVASTHTHAGPDTIGLWGRHFLGLPVLNGRDEQYVDWMIRSVADGIGEAVRGLEPVRIGFGEETSNKTDWIVNIQVEGREYYDNAFSVMKVDSLDGMPVACVSNFPCHPESLSDINALISPDFVGFMHDAVERETGAVSIFFNGALGAMVTANTDLESGDASLQRRFAREMGYHLGGIVTACWDTIRTSEIDSFQTECQHIRVPVQNRKFRFLFRLGLLRGTMRRGLLETSLFVLTIGEAQMASLPGEAAPVTGFAAKELMPARFRFLIGLGNDELGYLLNDEQYNDKAHYGYERTVSIGPRGLAAIMERFRALVRG